MSQVFIYPPSGAAASNPSTGTNNAPIPTSSTLVGGKSPTNTLVPITVDSAGNQIISPLTNSSVVKAQLQDNNGLAVVLGQQVAAGSLPVVLTAAQLTTLTPLSTVTVIQPTGSNLHVAVDSLPSIPAGANAIGSVSVSNFPATQPISGTVTVTQATGTNLHTVVDSSALPTGAATSANQTTMQTTLASIDGKTPALGQQLAAASQPVVLTAAQLTTLTPLTSVTVTQATGTNLHAVIDSGTVAATQSGTWNITNISGTVSLPTGASTSALQTTGNTSLATLATNSATLGQKTSAGSAPVVLASDQSAIPVASPTGRTQSFAPQYLTYSTTNVSTAAYTTIATTLSNVTNYLDIFDSSGQAMILATGAPGSEVILAYIPPGGDQISVVVPASTRIAYRALTANATSGYLLMNFYK